MGDTLLLSGEQMAELDERTVRLLGIPGPTLMESAAWACVSVAIEEFGEVLGLGVVVVCGLGSNGGDGLAIARRLYGLGIDVEVVLVGRATELNEAARMQWDIASALGVALREAPGEEPLAFASRSWVRKGLMVDAIFGIGLSRPVSGVAAAAVVAMAKAQAEGVPVLSVDLPSGVDATTGVVHGVAVRADTTVTFASPKLGHFLQPGRQQVGRLVSADIGIPTRHWMDLSASAARLVGPEDLRAAVPPASQDAHKGTFGHLLVVAGSPGMSGAARLCVDAALRSGAGLVTLAVPEALDISGLVAEAMVVRIPEGSWGAERILKLLETRDALAVGPGLGSGPETIFMARQLFAEAPVPAVFDADAINALVAAPPAQLTPAAQRVLTPHPGEFSRLVSAAWHDLAHRRVEVAKEVAARLTSTVLLKGASSLIVDPEGHLRVNPTGNPGMATAGTGDVLSGIVGALLARGVEAPAAAAAAAWWHGLAGDFASLAIGEPSLVAGDLVDHLGPAWRSTLNGEVPEPFTARPQLSS
jgi:NAD(P)H-hydrate epimerase